MSHFKYLLFIVCLTVFGCEEDKAQVTVLDASRSRVTEVLINNTGLISHVFSDTTILLHDGVESTDIHYLNDEGSTMHAFVLKVDLKQPDLVLQPLTPYGSTEFARQTIPDMLKYIKTPGSKALAAVNSGFFNMNTGEPRSIVYLKGEAVRASISNTFGYFGISKTGELMMGDAVDYEQRKDQIYNALGGHQRLVKGGKAFYQTSIAVEPRTAVGFTADNIVYFIVVDGRRFDYSNGITFAGLSEIMLALGAVEALNLDGGGSSTYVINNPLADVIQVRNRPSDGAPRAVANGWAVVAVNN